MTTRPGPASPRPAAPDPVAREEAPLSPPRPIPLPQSGTWPPALFAARISPLVRMARSNWSSSVFFSRRKPHQEPRPPPIFHRALEFEFAARIRCATRNNRQSQARPLRFCREKWLNYFFSQLHRNSRPVIFHRHQTVAIFQRNSHIHMPPPRPRVQRVYNHVRQTFAQFFLPI